MKSSRREAGVTILVAILAALAVVAPLASQPRTLKWKSIDVIARLDSTGRLHVREHQTMVFTGDWNGGERTFTVSGRQQFAFERLLRIDSVTRAERVLAQGDLSKVDNWNIAGDRTIRWRSRLATDPPFRETVLEYVLEFSYANVLVATDGRYRLRHNFAFAERPGTIDEFTVNLQLDNNWRSSADFTGSFRASRLPPGGDFVVTVPLEGVPAGQPATAPTGRSGRRQVELGDGNTPALGAAPRMRVVLALILLGAIAAMIRGFFRRERAAGRFGPLIAPHKIDAVWLSENLLHMRPEVVGAAWDNKTGAPEVAAILARLEMEKKLRSEVKSSGGRFFGSQVLHLKLLVPRDELLDYEKRLIDGLFQAGSDTTDTEQVRKRYKRSGFDPANRIRVSLRKLVEAEVGRRSLRKKPSGTVTMLLLGVAALLLIVSVIFNAADRALVILALLAGLTVCVISAIQANETRHRMISAAAFSAQVLLPVGLASLVLLVILLSGYEQAGFLTLAGLTVPMLAIISTVLNQATAREGNEALDLRRRLASARAFFVQQLRNKNPQLRDDWFPYLIAFGLGPQMDRWFAGFGGSVRDSDSAGDNIDAMPDAFSHSRDAASGWTGFGGGAGFARGGSSASWAAAAHTMSAGLPAPGAGGSDGGGGGDGNGGSSGGGGGGGW